MVRKVGDDPNGGGSLTVIDIGTTLNQRFLLDKELGRGGMGAVYSATDELLQRKVAIKLLKEQSGEEVGKRLRLEAQIAARLLHDYVVRIYDFGQAEGRYFLVMEEVQGSSYSKRWRNLALAERLRILAQVAEALDYAHHQGVVHRDVKPANVLLTASDVPKLSDFGLSMIAEHGDQTGIVRGTPHYMSPEQTRGSRLDYRTDLYSLGVMVYESATGTRTVYRVVDLDHVAALFRSARTAAVSQSADLAGARGIDRVALGQAAGRAAWIGSDRGRRHCGRKSSGFTNAKARTRIRQAVGSGDEQRSVADDTRSDRTDARVNPSRRLTDRQRRRSPSLFRPRHRRAGSGESIRDRRARPLLRRRLVAATPRQYPSPSPPSAVPAASRP